jgi:hypothetical protein
VTKDPDIAEVFEMADHCEMVHEFELAPGTDPFEAHRRRHVFPHEGHHHPFGVDDPRMVVFA